MSFDATQGDVSDFFRDCEVTNVRIVEDKLDHRPKGFGYVEFASLEGLKKALSYNGNQLGGRAIRISVADPRKSPNLRARTYCPHDADICAVVAKDRQDGRDFSDWSRKGPLPALPGSERRVSERSGFPSRSFDNMSDAGSERGSRRQFEQGDGKVRDFSNWERKGPLAPAAAAATSLQEGGRQGSRDGPGFRKTSPSWGEGRSQEGSRPPRREFQEKPIIERTPTAAELDNQWRAKMRPDAPAKSPTPSRETSTPPSPAPASAVATRPKLNLQKRTVSETDPGLSAASTTDSKASPFGAARPVDTLARDQEIEEKRQLALRQRREAEEKLKAEKAEEKRLAKDAKDAKDGKDKVVTEQDTKETGASETQENGSETPQPGKNFEILRRTSEPANDMVAPEDAEDEEEAGEPAIAEDKAVKPKEIVRDVPKAQANGAWRGKDTKKEPKSEPNKATNLEEDGWSTVSKNTKQRNNRRGNQAARAIAS